MVASLVCCLENRTALRLLAMRTDCGNNFLTAVQPIRHPDDHDMKMGIVRVAGTGSSVPAHEVTTATLGSLIERSIPGKGAAWASDKLGIASRRFMVPLDPVTGHPTSDQDELALAYQAARAALDDAGLEPEAIGGLWYVSCTQSNSYRHFSRAAFALHQRLGLPNEAFALEMDAGCGGAVHAISAARQLLAGGAENNILVVAANVPSQYFENWEAYARSGAWLSMYIFGDGAGAVVLQQTSWDESDRGILAAYTALDPSTPLMEFLRPDGQNEAVYFIDGRSVALSFRRYARLALDALQRKHPFEFDDVRRFYFHQVNANVLRDFVAEMGIPEERVAIHVDRYGNLAAAATLVLLDEDIRAGVVGPGDLCVLCAVGAGAQYGAILLRL